MTDNNQDIKTNEKMGKTRTSSGKRRAIIKGVAGSVPLVLTFRSGAAFAASSTGSCVSRDNMLAARPINTPKTLVDPTGADGWLRRRVFCTELTPVVGIELPFLVYNTGNNIAGWQHEDNTESKMVDGSLRTFKKTIANTMEATGRRAGELYTYTLVTDCDILVQLDPSVDPKTAVFNDLPIGKSDNLTDGTLPYVTGSCWASVSA